MVRQLVCSASRDDGEERRDQREGRVENRVLHPLASQRQHRRHGQPDHDAAAGGQYEPPCDPEDADRGEDRSRRGPQGHQGGGVVEQALALEDRDDPARHAHLAGDRRRGDGVRRGDHGTEREGSGRGDAGDDRPGHQADEQGREHHRPDCHDPDRLPVRAHVDQRGAQRGGVEQGWQEADQHDVGVDPVLRYAGNQ
jgi:hypothetical protein